ncbi:PREDICTED: uncharacterized protein LOC101306800 isoform 2 [Fragaria vesca subsp. vesca]
MMEAAGNPPKPGNKKKRNKKKGGKASNNQFGATNPTQANQDAPVQSVDSPLETWIFSTASSYHVTADREIMENYTSGNFGKVYLATGNSMDVVGKGDVRIKLSSNATWILRDVKHVPGYAWNQISVGVLCEKGYGMTYSHVGWKISKGDFAFTVPLDPNPPMRITFLSASPL